MIRKGTLVTSRLKVRETDASEVYVVDHYDSFLNAYWCYKNNCERAIMLEADYVEKWNKPKLPMEK